MAVKENKEVFGKYFLNNQDRDLSEEGKCGCLLLLTVTIASSVQ